MPSGMQHYLLIYMYINKQCSKVNTIHIWERVKRVVYWKIGISEMDISEIDVNPIHVISDMSISDISIAKNGHIGLDISEI